MDSFIVYTQIREIINVSSCCITFEFLLESITSAKPTFVE